MQVLPAPGGSLGASSGSHFESTAERDWAIGRKEREGQDKSGEENRSRKAERQPLYFQTLPENNRRGSPDVRKATPTSPGELTSHKPEQQKSIEVKSHTKLQDREQNILLMWKVYQEDR